MHPTKEILTNTIHLNMFIEIIFELDQIIQIMCSRYRNSMNTIWIFNSYFLQIEPSRRCLTLIVRRACELEDEDEIGFCHHREFLRFASEFRHAWFNIDALN